MYMRKEMQHFYKKLSIKNQNLTFYFNQLDTHDGMRYCISVVDGQGKTWLFYMMKKQERWVLTNPINYPDWIVALEQELSNIILQNESL